ncbi:protein still life, isoforms C/SIF type 2-like [Teleopsis dalmanni]|uniref:protein still life, isoforms C/SIF type 2-like n=1 Tax=Teleopsis dalmanni TaxID=139649 RepID=UPI0018CF7A74|nr:protein still life, isoforms C/SIF type 2-like [Teleopsis dalmanni]
MGMLHAAIVSTTTKFSNPHNFTNPKTLTLARVPLSNSPLPQKQQRVHSRLTGSLVTSFKAVTYFSTHRPILSPLILAASHNSESDNNNSVSGSGSDKKTFSLHCCCVIVDITPVSQAGRLTSATTASGRDVSAGGSASGGGGVLGDGVSQLASSLFRFGSKKRGVCICNAQCRLQSLGEGPLGPTIKTHHGSLDRLLQQQDQQRQLQPAATATRSVGGVVGGGGSGALLGSADSDGDGDDEKETDMPPPRPPSRTKPHAQQVKEEFDRGVEVEKFYHQINGDIFEITRRVRARDEDTIEQKIIKRKGSVRLPPEPPPRQAGMQQPHVHTHINGHKHHHNHIIDEHKPQLPPRRQKSAEEVPVSKSSSRAPDELEWFDRKAQQRHSARSAESGTVREETMEWLEKQRGPARTSSGPSEITVLKDEVPDWLLEHLPKKRMIAERQPVDAKTAASSYAKALKEELTELLKKPLSRQSSGPGEFSLLKTDVVEWLTKLQSTKPAIREDTGAIPKTRRTHHRRNGSGDTPRSHSQEDAAAVQQATRKRHSLGHSDRSEEEIADWIAYPLNRLHSIGKTPTQTVTERRTTQTSYVELHHKPTALPIQPICTERRHHERSRERKLRHSASEVVNGQSAAAITPTQLERLYAKPHKERYQYIPKHKDMLPPQLPPKETTMTTAVHAPSAVLSSVPIRESKRERSRRHQTQRSATVSDMSGSHNGAQKRKSSSAERAPRSPSPCTDPTCPLLPICTDPHCRFLECQVANHGLTTSTSTVNLARHQQVAKAQMHTVPPHAASDETPTPPPPPTQHLQRKLVICHECRSCAPLLTCQNRKCLNAAKCNSLPRCAADFNRLRTTLAQPPPTLDDIEPAPETPSPQMQRHGMHHRSNSQPNTLQRGDSRAALWQDAEVSTATAIIKKHPHNGRVNGIAQNGANGKLMKSASAASLNSRRRRHKTVHFGENLLREVCQNRKLIKTEQVPSGSAPMKSNIQMLYNFVEGVLSAWVDDDEDQVRSGAESEPEHGVMALKPIHRCNRLRYQCIKRIVSEAAELQGTLKLGNSRYRHRHWRSTAKQCNEMFLRKQASIKQEKCCEFYHFNPGNRFQYTKRYGTQCRTNGLQIWHAATITKPNFDYLSPLK